MPNHVVNRVTAPEEVLDLLKSPDPNGDVVDFNALVPMPTELSVEADMRTIEWAEIAVGKANPVKQLSASMPGPAMAESFRQGDYGTVADSLRASNLMRALEQAETTGPLTWDDDRFEQFLQMQRNVRAYGYPTWYDWSVERWGTKWNAYECERVLGSNVVTFQTAWGMPNKVALALFEKAGAATIQWEWADEDAGNNTGSLGLAHGKVSGGRLENDSAEGWGLYIDLHHDGQCPDYLERQPSGKYLYVEEAS